MRDRNSQQGIVKKKRVGFVKSPQEYEYMKFGPNSPIPDKWRVFRFIEYRIQNNKRASESEVLSREFIIETTGCCPGNFNRIIKSLEKDKLLLVTRGNYRDSCATYQINKEMFPCSVICPDLKKKTRVDKSASDVDNLGSEKKANFNLKFQNNGKLQIEVTKLQCDVEPDVTSVTLQADSPSRSPSSKSPEQKSLRSPEGGIEESFTLAGQTESQKQTPSALEWLKATDGVITFDEWHAGKKAV